MKAIMTSVAAVMLLASACGQTQPSSSNADAIAAPNLVRQVLSCTTSDGKYTVSIDDNQGIGPVRTSNFNAVITDAQGNTVGSYSKLKIIQSSFSISFGHQDYVDSASNGKKFMFDLPSTNFGNGLIAVLSDGTQIDYAPQNKFFAQPLSCK